MMMKVMIVISKKMKKIIINYKTMEIIMSKKLMINKIMRMMMRMTVVR